VPLLAASFIACLALSGCNINIGQANATPLEKLTRNAEPAQALPSMAPFKHGLNKVQPGQDAFILGRRLDDFQIHHDKDQTPQKRASVPFQYGYVDVPRVDGYAGPLRDPANIDAIIARSTTEQVSGDVRLYVDGQGQSQIKHRTHPHLDADWEWDVTLPNAQPGMIAALWTFSGPAYRNPDKLQFEFDIEIIGGGDKGPLIQANFHDGKGPAISFGELLGDWSGQRLHFRIEQRVSEGTARIFINNALFAEITRAEVEAAGRFWPSLPLYGVTDLWLVDAGNEGLTNWAGAPDLSMPVQTLTVHGYKLTPVVSDMPDN
jgi:hypothetical protein